MDFILHSHAKSLGPPGKLLKKWFFFNQLTFYQAIKNYIQLLY